LLNLPGFAQKSKVIDFMLDDITPLAGQTQRRETVMEPKLEFPLISETLMKNPQKRFKVNSRTISKTTLKAVPSRREVT
jgi:hypothetical protein